VRERERERDRDGCFGFMEITNELLALRMWNFHGYTCRSSLEMSFLC
jgi:hypothetical protein